MPAIDGRVASPTAKYTGRGLTSRQNIDVEVVLAEPGHGLIFEVTKGETKALIPAHADSVVNTLRNVTLGKDGVRLCIVEHILCAASLWGLEDLLIRVNGPEIPLGDGSASIWTDIFKTAGWEPKAISPSIELKEPVVCRKGDKLLMAVPDDKFSISYHMDWDHPLIGKCWQSWDPSQPVSNIADARTFGSLKEHQMLGIADEVVSFTPEGFTHTLRFPDEPVRHKLLDLLGDLTLSGVNPMSLKARFVSIKAGHELDVEMARKLAALISADRS